MSRAPFQILVLPFRTLHNHEWEVALFKRSDTHYWQGIAGGGEANESPLTAARREAFEEAGIPQEYQYYRLDTIAPIPVCYFKARVNWPKNIYVIPEYSFAVEFSETFILSPEHVEVKWVNYHEAIELLHWETNKTALWELNERLMNSDLGTLFS